MANSSNEIKTYGAIRCKTEEGKAVFAQQVYDEEQGQFQSEINQDVNDILGRTETTNEIDLNIGTSIGCFVRKTNEDWVHYGSYSSKFWSVSGDKLEIVANSNEDATVTFCKSLLPSYNLSAEQLKPYLADEEKVYDVVEVGTKKVIDIPIGTEYVYVLSTDGTESYVPLEMKTISVVEKSPFPFDEAPTENSNKGVTSGGVKEAIDEINGEINGINEDLEEIKSTLYGETIVEEPIAINDGIGIDCIMGDAGTWLHYREENSRYWEVEIDSSSKLKVSSSAQKNARITFAKSVLPAYNLNAEQLEPYLADSNTPFVSIPANSVDVEIDIPTDTKYIYARKGENANDVSYLPIAMSILSVEENGVFPFDETPTENSNKGVTSGGVKQYVDEHSSSYDDTALVNTINSVQAELSRVEGSVVTTREDVERIVDDKITEDWHAPSVVAKTIRSEYDIVFASEDSSPEDKALADYVCLSSNTQEVIQSAIDAWYADGHTNCGKFLFLDGTYYLTHFIEPSDNDAVATPYCIRMPRGKIKNTFNSQNTAFNNYYNTTCVFVGAHSFGNKCAKFVVVDDAYLLKQNESHEALNNYIGTEFYQDEDESGPARLLNDHKRYSVFRCESSGASKYGYSNWCSYSMEFYNLAIQCGSTPNSTRLMAYPIIMIDAIYSSILTVVECKIETSPFSAVYNYIHSIGLSGIRGPRGQAYGYKNYMRSNYITGFYHGIELGGEHWLLEDVTLRYNYFGISRGTYHDNITEGGTTVAGSKHCNVLLECALERNYFPMGFFNNGAGWTDGGVWDVRGLSIEWEHGQNTGNFTRGCFVEERNGSANSPVGFFTIQNKPWVSTSNNYEFDGIDRQFFTRRNLPYVKVEVLEFMNTARYDQYVWTNGGRIGEHGQKVYDTTNHRWMVWNNYPADASSHEEEEYKWGDNVRKKCYYGKWEIAE